MLGRWKHQLSTTSREHKRKEGDGAQREMEDQLQTWEKLGNRKGKRWMKRKKMVGM